MQVTCQADRDDQHGNVGIRWSLPSPTWPYPITCRTASSCSKPFLRNCSLVVSTTSLKEAIGTDMSYLYVFPSFETASGTPSRNFHSELNWPGVCESTPVVIRGCSASRSVSRRAVSFFSKENINQSLCEHLEHEPLRHAPFPPH